MMARRTILGLMAGAVSLLALGGCSGGVSTLRYRVTVEINTPEGVKTGSAVLEDAFNPGNSFEFSASRRIYGQAPMVDLGGGRYIFALVGSLGGRRSMQTMISRMFDYPEYPQKLDNPKLVDRFSDANERKPMMVIKSEDYPMVVTFDNIDDPTTVREVRRDIVRQITVQVVDEDEPLTEGIEARLGWLAEGSPDSRLEKFVQGSPLQETEDLPLSRRLSKFDFVWRKT